MSHSLVIWLSLNVLSTFSLQNIYVDKAVLENVKIETLFDTNSFAWIDSTILSSCIYGGAGSYL